MTTTLLPIFAADFGTFISVVFLVIAFLGWVMNIANANGKQAGPQQRGNRQGNRPRPPARPGGARPRPAQGQSEIDVFLDEVSSQRSDEDREREERARREREQAQRERQRQRERERQARQQEARQQQTRPQQTKPQDSRPKPPPRRDAGSGGRSTLSEQHKVDESVAQHMRHTEEIGQGVGQSVASHLGLGSTSEIAAAQIATASSSSARRVVGLLRNPQSVQQAIIINEVLSKPKSLR